MTEATWSPEQRKLVFATVAQGLSNADKALFEAVCLSSGLDPLRKEIYAVVRGGKMAIQTGIDGYLKLANQTKELNGMEVLFYDDQGNESEVWVKDEPPSACLVRVYRKGAQYPFTASCRFKAYSQNNQMWRKFPETMLAKATTTLALRRGFADVISGIASSDELDQAGLAAPEALTEGTPVATPKKAPKAAAKKPETPAPTAEAVKESEPAAEQVVTPATGTPGLKDFQSVGVEMGLTTFAIDGLNKLVKAKLGGDYANGIKVLQAKTPDQVEALNEQFKPATADEAAEKLAVATGGKVASADLQDW